MLKKIFFLHFIILISTLTSSPSYSEEKEYQAAKIIKIETKRPQHNPPTYPGHRSYNEPSKTERDWQQSEAFNAMIGTALESHNTYRITLQLEEMTIVAGYAQTWSWSRTPDWMAGQNVQVRLNRKKDRVFIKQSDGKEFEMSVLLKMKSAEIRG